MEGDGTSVPIVAAFGGADARDAGEESTRQSSKGLQTKVVMIDLAVLSTVGICARRDSTDLRTAQGSATFTAASAMCG